SDFGAGLFKPSLAGGLLEFLLLSANQPSSCLMRACITAITAIMPCTCCCKGHTARHALRLALHPKSDDQMHSLFMNKPLALGG
ncbi:MAG: hypothetical protein COY49_08075, partial [Comamonadaceae bacterium CG_4_10_14_0_8_um_filter_57_29]